MRPAPGRGLSRLAHGGVLLCVLGCACASTPDSGEQNPASGVQGAAVSEVHDPWEPMNRGIFAFNEFADRWLIEPVAIGWDFVLPEALQRGIENFFDNLSFPRRFANDWLQGKPRKAGEDLGRFLLNTSFGVGGLFDPAFRNGWLARNDEDFGQTLGVWGLPTGPYLVLPVYGPSNPRDTTGLLVDGYLQPERYFIPFYASIALTGGDLLNRRALALEEVRAERAAAFDFYAAVRRAYLQFRDNQVRDAAAKPEGGEYEDFFDLDEDLDEE